MAETIVWTRSKQSWLKDQKRFSLLEKNGDIKVLHIPTIEIEFVKVDLHSVPSASFDSVIFSSANAAKALFLHAAASSFLQKIPEILCIGLHTYSALKSQGFDARRFDHLETGEELCKELNSATDPKKYLFIGAKKPATDFVAGLSNHSVTMLSDYETTVLHVGIEDQNKVLEANATVCLASPSAVEAFRRTPAKILDLRCICIGPTTAARAKEVFKEVLVIETPNISLLAKHALQLAGHSD